MAILFSKTTTKMLIAPCLLLLMGLAEASTGEKPSIVLVMADDQGWGDIAYNGHPVLQTPNFDRAASAGDLPPHRSSQLAAQLPRPPYPESRFPGHSAWIDGDWKLHRITDKTKGIRWALYDLARDPKEEHDRSRGQNDRVRKMGEALEAWLVSVVESLNGEDY